MTLPTWRHAFRQLFLRTSRWHIRRWRSFCIQQICVNTIHKLMLIITTALLYTPYSSIHIAQVYNSPHGLAPTTLPQNCQLIASDTFCHHLQSAEVDNAMNSGSLLETEVLLSPVYGLRTVCTVLTLKCEMASFSLPVYAWFSVCLHVLVMTDISHFHGILTAPLAVSYITHSQSQLEKTGIGLNGRFHAIHLLLDLPTLMLSGGQEEGNHITCLALCFTSPASTQACCAFCCKCENKVQSENEVQISTIGCQQTELEIFSNFT